MDAILLSLYLLKNLPTEESEKNVVQGGQTLSHKSNLLILPHQSWYICDSLGFNWPQDVRKLHSMALVREGSMDSFESKNF